MSDFLTHLAARSLGSSGTAGSEVIQPRIPSLFEPYQRNSGPELARPHFDRDRDPRDSVVSEASSIQDSGPVQTDAPPGDPRVLLAQVPLGRDAAARRPEPRSRTGFADSMRRGSGERLGRASSTLRPAVRPDSTALRTPWAGRNLRPNTNSDVNSDADSSEIAPSPAPPSGSESIQPKSPGEPVPAGEEPHVSAARTQRQQKSEEPSRIASNAHDLRRSFQERSRLSSSPLPSAEPPTTASEQPSGSAARALRPAANTVRPQAERGEFSQPVTKEQRQAQDVEPAIAASAQHSVRSPIDNASTRRFRPGEATPPVLEGSGSVNKPGRKWGPTALRRLADPESGLAVPRSSLRQTLTPGAPAFGDMGSWNQETRLFTPLASVIRPPVRTQSGASGNRAIPRGADRAEPSIQVTIGSVEVRAILPERPTALPAVKRPRPSVSLDEYLKGSERGVR